MALLGDRPQLAGMEACRPGSCHVCTSCEALKRGRLQQSKASAACSMTLCSLDTPRCQSLPGSVLADAQGNSAPLARSLSRLLRTA